MELKNGTEIFPKWVFFNKYLNINLAAYKMAFSAI